MSMQDSCVCVCVCAHACAQVCTHTKKTRPHCEVSRSLCLLAALAVMDWKGTWDAVVQGSPRVFKMLKWRKVMESDELFRILSAVLFYSLTCCT